MWQQPSTHSQTSLCSTLISPKHCSCTALRHSTPDRMNTQLPSVPKKRGDTPHTLHRTLASSLCWSRSVHQPGNRPWADQSYVGVTKREQFTLRHFWTQTNHNTSQRKEDTRPQAKNFHRSCFWRYTGRKNPDFPMKTRRVHTTLEWQWSRRRRRQCPIFSLADQTAP